MISNRSMPRCTVIPEIPYPDPSAAASWLCDAFGFRIRLRIANHRIQLNVGGCAIVVVESHGETSARRTLVRVEDVDAHHDRAVKHGAGIQQEPQTWAYGERQYTAIDPAGHHWTFSESVQDVDPEDWGGTSVEL